MRLPVLFLCFLLTCTSGLPPAFAQTGASTQVLDSVGQDPAPVVVSPVQGAIEKEAVGAPVTQQPVEAVTSLGAINVQGNQIVSSTVGPLVLKGVNFEGSWKYSEGQKLDEVAKTGANSVRIVWNVWQNTDNLAKVIDRAIANGLVPILEIHDSTIGHQLSSEIGDAAAFRKVVSWWVSPDVKNVLLPRQDKMIINIANEAFRTDFGLERFVEEYATAIRQLRAVGYTTHFVIDGPQWGEDYRGGVARLRELQKVDGNISLGVHMYISFLPANAIDDLFEYMAGTGIPWIVGEFSIQTPGCSGELNFHKVMRLANLHGVGYQAWSWGHGNTDCLAMDMTLPNGDSDNLTAWGRVVAEDLANSPSYLLSVSGMVESGGQEFEAEVIEEAVVEQTPELTADSSSPLSRVVKSNDERNP